MSLVSAALMGILAAARLPCSRRGPKRVFGEGAFGRWSGATLLSLESSGVVRLGLWWWSCAGVVRT